MAVRVRSRCTRTSTCWPPGCSPLQPGERVAYRLKPGRHAWLQVAWGAVTLNGVQLKAGDGVAISEEEGLEVSADDASELLLFDLA